MLTYLLSVNLENLTNIDWNDMERTNSQLEGKLLKHPSVGFSCLAISRLIAKLKVPRLSLSVNPSDVNA